MVDETIPTERAPIDVIKALVSAGDLRYIGNRPDQVDVLYATSAATGALAGLGLEVSRVSNVVRSIHQNLQFDTYGATISISGSRARNGSLVELLGGYGAVEGALQGIKNIPSRRVLSPQFDARGQWGAPLR